MDTSRTTPAAAAPPPPAPPGPPRASEPPLDDDVDHTRTGAVWVTAMGALLVFAAAATFVALRWETIPDPAKLGVLGGITGGMLAAGRSLRRSLPATAGVLFHLGAFLIPVNIAAVGVHLGWSWEVLLTVEGSVGAIVYGTLGRLERSKPLDWAAVLSMVLAAGGLGAASGVPAPALLAAAALAASLAGLPRAATAWALVAGAAPALTLATSVSGVLDRPRLGAGVLDALGLVGTEPERTAVVVGLVTAGVLVRRAHQTRDLVWGVLAVATATMGLVTTWVGIDPDGRPGWAGIGALFLLIELVATLLRRDALWSRLAGPVADVAEVVVGAATLLALGALGAIDLAAIWLDDTPVVDRNLLVACSFALVAWFLADLRRREDDSTSAPVALLVGGGFAPSTVLLAATVGLGALAGTGSPVAAGVAAGIVGAVLVATGRPLAHTTALVCAVAAPALAAGEPSIALALGLLGSVTLAGAVVLRARIGTELAALEAWLLDAALPVPALAGLSVALIADAAAVGAGPDTLVPAPALAIGLTGAVLWGAALLVDRAAHAPDTSALGLLPRAAAGLCLLGAPALSSRELAVLAGLATIAYVVDALRRDEPMLAFGAAATAPVAIIAATFAAGGTATSAGVALCAATVIPAALSLRSGARWVPAIAAVGAAFSVPGLALAAGDTASLGTAGLCLGGVGVALGAARRQSELWVIGGIAATLGIWLRLGAAGIEGLDAWVAPVAVLLAAVGLTARRPMSSWVSLAPAVALLGGAALAERLAGGSGVHALVAGGVGVVAVVAGGSRRWIGPMLTGTAVLVVLTLHESLGVTRAVPNTVWLALGGAVLIAAGIMMERHDTGPLETGRRIADIVHERFH